MAQEQNSPPDISLSNIHEEYAAIVNYNNLNSPEVSPWQIILHDNHAGKLVIYNNETKEVEVFVSNGRRVPPTAQDTSLRRNESDSGNNAAYADPDYFDLLHHALEAEQLQTPSQPSSLSSSASPCSKASQSSSMTVTDDGSNLNVNDSASATHSTACNGSPLCVPPASSPPTTTTTTKLSGALNSGYFRRFFVEERRIGTGGYGAVFLVRHRINAIDLGTYALKKVPVGEDEAWLQRVLKEVKALETLCKHPNIINYKHAWLECDQIADFGPPVPCLYILMEFANGGNLWDYVLQHSPLSETLVWSFFVDIVLGLDCLHALDIVHHDLKAQNLLLHYAEPRSRTPHILISDFGTCEMLKKKSPSSCGPTGSLEWMPPEALGTTTMDASRKESANEEENVPPGACDIWSLGLVLYFMTFAQLPYKNTSCERILDSQALVQEIRTFTKVHFPCREPPVSSSLLEMIEWLLQPNPRLRPSIRAVLQSSVVQRHLAQRHSYSSFNVTNPPPITTTCYVSSCQSSSVPTSQVWSSSATDQRPRPRLTLPHSRFIRTSVASSAPLRRQTSTELLKNVPASFIVPSPPPSLQNTPEASLDDLSAYFRLMSKSPTLLDSSRQFPPLWFQVLHMILLIAKVAVSLFGCGSHGAASNIHTLGVVIAAALTFLLASYRQGIVMQIVLTCGQWLWTAWYVFRGRLCDVPLTGMASLTLLLICTLLYAFSLTLLFVNRHALLSPIKVPFNVQTLPHELTERLKKMQ
jgi:serine/threonine protein kinase